MAEDKVFQKLRRVARKFELKIHKLTGADLFVLVGDSVQPSAPMTLEQLEKFIAELEANNQD